MKSNFEFSLLETGETLKKGYSALVQNIGKAIAIITGFLAVLITFTEISFYDVGSKDLTSTALMLLIASYLIFFSLVDAGEKLGRESKEYKEAKEKYEAVKQKIEGDSLPSLRRFCKEYAEEELVFRRENVLASFGFGYEEYKKYKESGKCSPEMKRAFKKADRQKPIKITPGELLTGIRRKERKEFSNPDRARGIKLILKLIPSTLCMLLTVSIMLKAKDGLSFAYVVEGMLRLSALPIIGLKGYSTGYSYAKNDTVFWLETKRRLIEAFLKTKPTNL